MNYRVLYTSSLASGTRTEDIFAIIKVSERNNPGKSITGFLIEDRQRFMQLLEGPRAEVEQTMKAIRKDARHENVKILLEQPAAERFFPDWSMKHLVSFTEKPAMEQLRLKLEGDAEGAAILEHVMTFVREG